MMSVMTNYNMHENKMKPVSSSNTQKHAVPFRLLLLPFPCHFKCVSGSQLVIKISSKLSLTLFMVPLLNGLNW